MKNSRILETLVPAHLAIPATRGLLARGVRRCIAADASHNTAQYDRGVREHNPSELQAVVLGAEIDPRLGCAARESPHYPG